MLIPLRPLRGGAAYTVTASLTSGTTTLTKRWRFATARENEVTQQLEVASATEFRVVVTSTAPEPAVAVDGKPVAVSREGALWQSAPLRIRGALAVCARSGGGTTGYVAVVPFNALSILCEQVTDQNGWAALRFSMRAGISTRRLFSARADLKQ